MGRGFLAGIFWGAVVGVALLFVSSQTLDRQQMSFPQPEASAVEVPGGSEFDQARVETDPVLPEPERAPEAGPTQGIAMPVDEVDAPPAMDTSALEVPVPAPVQDAPAGLGEAPEQEIPTDPAVAEDTTPAGGTAGSLVAPEAPASAPETVTDEPVAPATEPEADETPAPEVTEESEAPEAEAEVATLPEAAPEEPEPATDQAPEVAQQDEAPAAMTAPEIADEPSLPVGDVTVMETPSEPSLPQIVAPEAESQPEVQDAPAETEIAAVEPEPSDAAEEAVEESTSLPQPVEEAAEGPDDEPADGAGGEAGEAPEIVDQASEEPTDGSGDEAGELPTVLRIGEADEAEAEVVQPAEEDIAETPATEGGPALAAYGIPFENPEGRPLVSIVLVHEGETALDRSKLDGLPANLSIAVDAGREDASSLAAAYRAAGREVVMIPSLPSGARPQDVEQALRANFDKIPEAVALMDASGSTFQSDRNAVAQIVAVVSDSGHGLITFPRGLNTAHQEAGRAGVPAGLIFRDIDGGGETQEQIGRALDRAAFRARQNEAVILVGRTTDVTLEAIAEWSLGSRAESVTLAPVSAALGGS